MTITHAKYPRVATTTTRDFTLWALDSLRFPVEQEDEQVYRFLTPEAHRESLNGACSVRFAFADPNADERLGASVERVVPGSRMLCWLIQQLHDRSAPLHAVPRGDITDPAQLEGPLTSAFTATGGSVRLDRCCLTPRPIVRLAYQLTGPDDDTEHLGFRFVHFLSDDTTSIDRARGAGGEWGISDELAKDLGLDDVRGCDAPPGSIPDDWPRRLDLARRAGDDGWDPESVSAEFVLGSLVWCNYAEGRLVAEFGERRVELPFCGWARQLASGKQQPPAFQCPVSGRESRRLELEDGGQVTVAEALGTCAECGRRVPTGSLRTCAATGRRALAEFLATCPVTGRRVLESCRIECADCGQAVSPDSVENGRCPACRNLSSISKDDPRMARILGEYPKLDRWSGWRLCETETVYVLTAVGWFRRLLLVIQKDSLEAGRLATAGRLRGGWSETPVELRGEILA